MLLKGILTFAILLGLASSLHVAVQNGTGGKYCIVLDSEVTGRAPYYNTYQNKTVFVDFTVPNRVNATGNCFDTVNKTTYETMTFYFVPVNVTATIPRDWSIHLKFVKPEGSAESFKIVDYKLNAVFYPQFNASASTSEVTYTKTDGAELEWGASETHGFTCSKAGLSLTNDSTIIFNKLKVLAFAMLDKDQFPEAQLFEQCKLDVRTSDLVPIIVGACLAGLVIIVLVAYLIGRARAKRQGYASV